MLRRRLWRARHICALCKWSLLLASAAQRGSHGTLIVLHRGVEGLIAAVFYDVFTLMKFCFGFGALLSLMGIGLLLLWFFLRVIVGYTLRGQPAGRYLPLRKLILDF